LRIELDEASYKTYVQEPTLAEEYEPLKWSLFKDMVTYLMYVRAHFPTLVTECISHARENCIAPPPPKVDDYTEFRSVETIPRDKDEEEPSCPICYLLFGQRKTPSDKLESAMKTTCGHHIGKSCLEVWTDSGNQSCPECRGELLGPELLLPQAARRWYRQFVEEVDDFAKLDESIDILWGPSSLAARETHNFAFGMLLYRLKTLSFTVGQARTELVQETG
jgi:hypothetical protein